MADIDDRWYSTGPDGERKPTARHGTGKRWAARWRDDSGKQRMCSFDRKLDADSFLAGLRADRLRGSYVDPKRGNVTLREYGDGKYLPSQFHLRPNSADTYASHLKNHIYPALGGHRMGSLARTDMKAFVAVLAGKLAPSTTETVFAVLRALMQSAVDDGVIAANPCTRIKLPKADKHVVEPMPAAAVLALLEAITPRYRVMVVLGAGAGLREGEAFGLTVPRVDFLRRKLHIRDQAQRGATAAPLKTRASRRVIPADDWVLAEITAHMQAYAPGPGQVIVTNRCGRVAQRNSFGTCWREAVTAAGLPAGTRFHDLRHFYASTLKVSGVAAVASFSRSGERTLPAVQRAALGQARSHDGPGTMRDLGRHHPVASGRTMMQPVRLQRMPA